MGGKNGDDYYEDALSRGILQTMVVFDTKKTLKRLYSDSADLSGLAINKLNPI
jgi:hypothetical protein